MRVIERFLWVAIAIALIVAFATVKTNLTLSLDCFVGAVLGFIALLPYEEGVWE